MDQYGIGACNIVKQEKKYTWNNITDDASKHNRLGKVCF